MTHPDIVQRLRELLEKATPEWEACDPGDYGDFDGDSRIILGGGIANPMRIAVFHWHDNDDWREENDANIELAVEARSHLPTLLTEITTLRQQLAEAREALEPFVSGYEHTSIFLRSREKMHEAGRSLYAEDVQRARAIIAKIEATLTPGGNHG